MRCEVMKQNNESDLMELERKNMRFLDHVRQFEEQIERNKQLRSASFILNTAPVLTVEHKNESPSAQNKGQDQKSLKTKTYFFEGHKSA